MKAAQAIKKKIMSIINDMATNPEPFVKNPGKDFTRNRKLNLSKTLILLLGMGGRSIRKELLVSNEYAIDTATASAFVQQREKILPSALDFLFSKFTQSLSKPKTYLGFRLLAMDGSDLRIPVARYADGSVSDGVDGGRMHLNTFYDMCNNLYTDAIIQDRHSANEHAALVQMVDRSPLSGKTILLADRGLEAYNNMAHIERKGWNYLFRVKDVHSSGILSGLNLPDTEEFDLDINLILTSKFTKEIRAQRERYRCLMANANFNFFTLDTNPFYPISFRVVRVKITDKLYETIITNLSRKKFDVPELKRLYNIRWGIETSYRDLKYAVGLIAFHSKKAEYVSQEIFAALTMYNFSQWIVSHTIMLPKNTRYDHKANFSIAVLVCRAFFLSRKSHPPDVEALIRKDQLPVREGRRFPRDVRTKPAVSFTYRIS